MHSLTYFPSPPNRSVPEWAGPAKYAVFFDGLRPKRVLTADYTVSDTVKSYGTIQVPYILGSPIISTGRWSWAIANEYLHGFNGTDKKMLDRIGIFRDIGLPPLAGTESSTAAVGVADADGIPASTVGGSQPGYQFYGCMYNRVTGDVGNRSSIGARVVPGAASFINLAILPDLSTVDPECDIILGRTKDGGEVPYAIIDDNGNFVYVRNGLTSYTVINKDIDNRYELPSRNDQPPALDKVIRVGNRFFGSEPDSQYVRYTESEAQASESGQYGFLGIPFHAWPADNVETFPTGEFVTCMAEYGMSGWYFTSRNMAILVDQAGVLGWQGPWDKGCAGQDAFVKTPYGPFWVTGDKELATMSANGPISVSGEYEKALLSKIVDSELSNVQVRYHCDPIRGIDVLFIKGINVSNAPIVIVHDFKLGGQAYEIDYEGALSSNFDCNIVVGQSSRTELWAVATDGTIHKLFSGSNDDGTEYTADAIFLLNAGPEKPLNPYLEWVGDENIQWDIAQSLTTALADYESLTDSKENIPGDEAGEPRFRVSLKSPECGHVYVRARLTSHSADGSIALNDPPHVPLETYGQLYMLSPMQKPGK